MYYGYLETFKILEGCYTHIDTRTRIHTRTHTHTHTRKKNVPAIYDNDKIILKFLCYLPDYRTNAGFLNLFNLKILKISPYLFKLGKLVFYKVDFLFKFYSVS